jgi:predicted ATP-binding protein involved in virulence
MHIQSLHLENIKAFEQIDLDFLRQTQTGDRAYAGLNFFVGGNSSGKSTLLKCLAMALSGPTIANQQLITPAGWVRRDATKGLIELKVHWDPVKDAFRIRGGTPSSVGTFDAGIVFEVAEPRATPTLKEKLYTTPNRTKVRSAERGPWHPDAIGWSLGAYGPLRRLTGSSTEALRYALGKGKLASCVTLFREDAALSESETWLKQEHARVLEQKSQSQIPSSLVDDAQAFLNDGLLPDGFQITRITVDHVYMTTPNGGELPLRDLSDGCRSAYALMLDIIHNMALTYGPANLFSRDAKNRIVVNQPGVILIDELEAHLHPSWQRTICEWLKIRFPLVQFFITTHSPLIVQAADPGGIFVLPLPNEVAAGRVVRRLNQNEQQRIVLGRSEKVLLGEAFGLKHTWGVQADNLVRRWEELTARREATGTLPAQDQQEYKQLTRQMRLVFDDNVEETPSA